MYLSSHSFHIKHPYNRHHCCDSFDYLSSVQLVFMCASIGCNLLLLSCCVKIVCIIVAYPCISTHRCKGVYDFSSYFFHPRRVCHHSHIMFAFTIKQNRVVSGYMIVLCPHIEQPCVSESVQSSKHTEYF